MARTERALLAELWDKYRQDDVSILVSSLAYYTFFSLFPLLLLLESVMGFLFGMGPAFARLQQQVVEVLPFSSGFLTGAIEKIIRARRSLSSPASARASNPRSKRCQARASSARATRTGPRAIRHRSHAAA